MNDKSLEDLKTMLEEDETNQKGGKSTQKWAGFVESTVVNFSMNTKSKSFL